jgi:hypothetical protein
VTTREQLRSRLAALEAEQASICAQIAALDEGEQAYRERAKAIAQRMADIERDARWQHERQAKMATEDVHAGWATDPLAIEWRRLMVEWWALPVVLPESIARLSPTYERMLTTRSTVNMAGKSDGERHMDACSRHQQQLRAKCA